MSLRWPSLGGCGDTGAKDGVTGAAQDCEEIGKEEGDKEGEEAVGDCIIVGLLAMSWLRCALSMFAKEYRLFFSSLASILTPHSL